MTISLLLGLICLEFACDGHYEILKVPHKLQRRILIARDARKNDTLHPQTMTILNQLKWIVPSIVMAVAIFVAYDVSLYQPDPTGTFYEDVTPEHEEIHVCQHDHITKDMPPHPQVPQNYGPPTKHQDGNLHFSANAGDQNGDEEHFVMANIGLDTPGVNTIRIKFDTSMLYLDSRTCFPGVDKVKVGTPASTSVICAGSDPTDCWMACTSDLIFDEARRQRMVTDLIPFAKNHFEHYLGVKSVVGDLTLGGQTPAAWGYCGDGTNPDASRVNYTMVDNTHPNTDMVIVVCARPLFGNTLAQAVACQADTKGRPIAGWIIFRPDKIMGTLPFVRGVMTHELTHALGFSHTTVQPFGASVNESLFIDPNTEVRRSLSEVQVIVNRTNTFTNQIWPVNLVKTPKVLEVVREHFNCPTLEGAALEDQGGGGTANSHWEKRIFATEYMAGSSPKIPIYSDLTFAFLEDTGFYFVFWNRTNKDNNLRWGWHEGCHFPGVSCNEWTDTTNVALGPKPEYWCTDSSLKGCNYDMSAKGACGLPSTPQGDYSGNPFNPRYQYFSNPLSGGYDQLPDWCPFLFGYQNYYCDDATEPASTTVPQPTPKAFGALNYGETWGTGSKCFKSTFLKPGSLVLSRGIAASCHKTACATDTLLKVNVAGFWYDCPASQPGKQITNNEYSGILTCPDAWQNPCGKYQEADPTWPLVTSVTPTSGNAKGGYTVTLIGERFTQGMKMYCLDSEMTNVVIHGPTNATGVVARVDNIKKTGIYQIFIKDTSGRMGTVDFGLTPISINLSQVLTALLIFLTDYAVPLTVASIAGLCGYSVKKEYEALRGNLPQKEYY